MEELIFFAVIIFFSILESIARSRRQKKGGQSGEDGLPGLPDPSEWEVTLPEFDLPTYDEDPSYDDPVETERSGRPAPSTARRPPPSGSASRPGGATRPGGETRSGGEARPSSEEMLPGDLLEELSRMAGRVQERRAQTLRLPKESPPLPDRVEQRVPTRVGRPTPARTAQAEHRIHQAHAGYGTDPSSRAPSLEDGLDPLAEKLSADAAAVRAQLRSLDLSALRQAVILREVLGQPVAMRD